jgi:hypothetical protein
MLDWHSLSCRSGQDAVQLFFPLMSTFEEKKSRVPPVPVDHGVTPPPLQMSSCLMLWLYIINSLEVEEAGCVSIWAHKLTWPQFYVCFVCCLLSFLHLLSPSVRFLGQACSGCETFLQLDDILIILGLVKLQFMSCTLHLFMACVVYRVPSNICLYFISITFCVSMVQWRASQEIVSCVKWQLHHVT